MPSVVSVNGEVWLWLLSFATWWILSKEQKDISVLRQGICYSVSSAQPLLAVQLFSEVQYHPSHKQILNKVNASLSGPKLLQKRFKEKFKMSEWLQKHTYIYELVGLWAKAEEIQDSV